MAGSFLNETTRTKIIVFRYASGPNRSHPTGRVRARGVPVAVGIERGWVYADDESCHLRMSGFPPTTAAVGWESPSSSDQGNE